ncbi:MAG: 2-oxoacid:acceptor oxidoreductase subunit alpha [bacterium]
MVVNKNAENVIHDLSLVFCGEAGQGIQTIEYILTRVLKLDGFFCFATKEYMSRVRGGSNSTQIRVSSDRVAAFVDRIDLLIPLDQDAIPHLEKRISKKTLIIGEKGKIKTSYNMVDVPFSELATSIGNPVFSNVIAVGLIAGLLKVDKTILEGYLRKHFSKKKDDLIQKNIQAVNKGYLIGEDFVKSNLIKLEISRNSVIKDEVLINGAEAVSMGALKGGCNFISAYPMSPSTGVLTFLAGKSHEFGVFVDQAEDEISGINMGLGASFAGARALVSTSGGGFALMAEGVSLAGMIETPIVIHVAQRPGPATGLPTRTEQSDMELVLYAGHGEFPRIIFSPGTIEDAFYLTDKAFALADKYQIPVFILTDQFLMDSFYAVDKFNINEQTDKRFITKTESSYKRFRLTDDGISPRGIPGFGDGLVVVDSDEHDEEGHLTENLDIRIQMVDKRLKKLDAIKKDIIAPELIGSKDYTKLIICWGTPVLPLREAVGKLNREDIAILYFKQVYPIHPDVNKYLKKAGKIIIIEGNATAQFAKLIKLYNNVEIDNKILKYNGSPFSVEELTEKLKQFI